MSCFRAPGHHNPPAFTNFVRRREPPGTKMVEDFWGSAVYDFMMKKLAAMPKKKLLWHFTKEGAEVCCGLVFGNGGQQSGQMSELGHIVSQGEHFWPVIFVIVEGLVSGLVPGAGPQRVAALVDASGSSREIEGSDTEDLERRKSIGISSGENRIGRGSSAGSEARRQRLGLHARPNHRGSRRSKCMDGGRLVSTFER